MNKILVITDHESDLVAVMKESGLCVTVLPTKFTTPPSVSDFDALALLGGCCDSPLIPTPLCHLLLEKMHEAGKPVFCEFVGSILATRDRGNDSTARQRMVYRANGFSADGVCDGDLLDGQSNECIKYAPLGNNSRPILSYVEYLPAHSHLDVSEDEHKAGKWALWWFDGNMLISSIRLSSFHRARFAPTEKWRALITSIVEFLAGEKVNLHFPAPIVEYKRSTVRSSEDARDTVARGIKWIKSAGLLKEGGRLGYDEGYSSRIDAKSGEQSMRKNVRADCTGEIGGALLFDWLINKNAESETIAKALFDFNFRYMQVKDGEHKGMIRWSELAWETCYQDDVARAILPLLLVQHIDGSAPYVDEICDAIDYMLKDTADNGIRPACTEICTTPADEAARRAPRGRPCAHFNAYYHAVMLLAHRITGNDEYLDVAAKGLTTIMSAYPSTVRETSETEEMARLILPLAVLYGITKDPEHKEWLYRVASDLEKHRHASGGYAEWDTGYTAACARNHKGECALLAENGDPVADLLYTNNWLPLAFSYAYMVTRDEVFFERWASAASFFASSQMYSSHVHLDGAWARAFDLDRCENFGIPYDAGWGPYCIESGWTVGEILMGLMFMSAVKK